MRARGVEPPRPFGHQVLSLARMPVPPRSQRTIVFLLPPEPCPHGTAYYYPFAAPHQPKSAILSCVWRPVERRLWRRVAPPDLPDDVDSTGSDHPRTHRRTSLPVPPGIVPSQAIGARYSNCFWGFYVAAATCRRLASGKRTSPGAGRGIARPRGRHQLRIDGPLDPEGGRR